MNANEALELTKKMEKSQSQIELAFIFEEIKNAAERGKTHVELMRYHGYLYQKNVHSELINLGYNVEISKGSYEGTYILSLDWNK